MFGFEYVLLAIASISTLMRYGLSLVELAVTQRQENARDEARRVAREQARQQATAEGAEAPLQVEEEDDDTDVPGWEEKGRWVFYLDLATDLVKALVYMGFFTVLMTFYGIPIHIMRDLFMSVRSLIKRINDFIQYRNATRDMNTRYPDATGDDLSRENICIVCREEMRPWTPPGAEGAPSGRRVDERQRPKKLPCGHILHFSCLRSWLERQQVCPTCRRPVLGESTPPPTQPNDQANPAPQNQQNQPNGPYQGVYADFCQATRSKLLRTKLNLVLWPLRPDSQTGLLAICACSALGPFESLWVISACRQNKQATRTTSETLSTSFARRLSQDRHRRCQLSHNTARLKCSLYSPTLHSILPQIKWELPSRSNPPIFAMTYCAFSNTSSTSSVS